MTDGSGSNRASAFRIGAGGRQQLVELLEDRRALDVRRSDIEPVVWSATRADDPRDPEPDARGQRRAEHSVDLPQPGDPQRRAGADPEPLEATGEHPPASSAPIRPNSGAYGECEPPGSSSGPSRVPRNAPSPNPTSDSAPTMNPCM